MRCTYLVTAACPAGRTVEVACLGRAAVRRVVSQLLEDGFTYVYRRRVS